MIVVQGDRKFAYIIRKYFSNIKCRWNCNGDNLYYYKSNGEVSCCYIEELSDNDIILTYRELLEL